MLLSSNRMAIAGMAFVALSVTTVMALISDVIFNTVAAVVVAVGIGG